MGKVENVVFLSLVLDLFGECLQPCHCGVSRERVAFTVPLPLFPRIIEWYTQVCVPSRPMCSLNLNHVLRGNHRIPMVFYPGHYGLCPQFVGGFTNHLTTRRDGISFFSVRLFVVSLLTQQLTQTSKVDSWVLCSREWW